MSHEVRDARRALEVLTENNARIAEAEKDRGEWSARLREYQAESLRLAELRKKAQAEKDLVGDNEAYRKSVDLMVAQRECAHRIENCTRRIDDLQNRNLENLHKIAHAFTVAINTRRRCRDGGDLTKAEQDLERQLEHMRAQRRSFLQTIAETETLAAELGAEVGPRIMGMMRRHFGNALSELVLADDGKLVFVDTVGTT